MSIRGFDTWEDLYKGETAEKMPWYYKELDHDVKAALKTLEQGGKALDLGTGPGTQAIALAKLGFEVTGTDLSRTAVDKAAERAAAEDTKVHFSQDDILNSKLSGPFDLVIDRGCFHVFEPEQRAKYLDAMEGLLGDGSVLLLKCFSHKQPGDEGPKRLSPDDIRGCFEPRFKVESIEETTFHGTMDEPPKALFCVIRPGSSKTQ